MSELRPLRDRLEALHGELARARASSDEVASAEEIQRLGEALGALRGRVASLAKQVSDEEALLWQALMRVRGVQAAALARVSQHGSSGRGGLGPFGTLVMLSGLWAFGLAGHFSEHPPPDVLVAAVVALCAVTAPGLGWYAWYRVRLARAIEEAQRLL